MLQRSHRAPDGGQDLGEDGAEHAEAETRHPQQLGEELARQHLQGGEEGLGITVGTLETLGTLEA